MLVVVEFLHSWGSRQQRKHMQQEEAQQLIGSVGYQVSGWHHGLQECLLDYLSFP
jgi:hypothetical protein